jgi:aldose sugar dehydrogenase
MKSAVLLLVLCLSITVSAQSAALTDAETGVQYRVEKVVNANFPVGMVFLPDGSLLYNEKTTGNVRLIDPDGTTQIEPVINLPTDALQERGMLGIAIDPNFEENQFVYVVHTRLGTARDFPSNELVRFRLVDGQAEDLTVLASYPIETGELFHNGGNVHFDNEGYLFLSLGDYGNAAFSQDLTVPQGKIHRFEVTEEGIIPAIGNPFGDDNSVYAYGFRNPFDFTFDRANNRLYTTEVGPSCDDEVNIVLMGFNYGWRENYECAGTDLIVGIDRYIPPMLSYTPVEAPTGIIIYRGAAFPEWQGNLFFCNWLFGDLRRVVLDETGSRVESVHSIDLGDEKCRIDLLESPDGELYFGTVGEQTGAIMRVVKP